MRVLTGWWCILWSVEIGGTLHATWRPGELPSWASVMAWDAPNPANLSSNVICLIYILSWQVDRYIWLGGHTYATMPGPCICCDCCEQRSVLRFSWDPGWSFQKMCCSPARTISLHSARATHADCLYLFHRCSWRVTNLHMKISCGTNPKFFNKKRKRWMQGYRNVKANKMNSENMQQIIEMIT